jgi:hypothetical protein
MEKTILIGECFWVRIMILPWATVFSLILRGLPAIYNKFAVLRWLATVLINQPRGNFVQPRRPCLYRERKAYCSSH